ncbi:MAG TPA: PD-(D/E)XK nuclease family protein [Gemmatimonadaceae bacterium]
MEPLQHPQASATTRAGIPAESRLLAALLEATGRHPTDRKLLVGPDVNWGRELLLAAARRRGGWIGWEATTLREVASELALVPLATQGLRVAGDIELAALVNAAIDTSASQGQLSPAALALGSSLGFRTAMLDSVLELRAAGVAPARLLEHAPRGTPAHDLGVVATAYEEALERGRVADTAAVFREALKAFDREAPYTITGQVHLAPGLALRGLARALALRLLDAGATILDGDLPAGLEPPVSLLERRVAPREGDPRSPLAWCGASELPPASPPLLAADALTVDLFAAATPSDELREALRRAVAEGWRLDQVEIVTTDPDTYGVALDALAQRLGIGCTMLAGIPLARTRLGRALERWLTWLAEGLPADVLRQAIEAGELRAPVAGDDAVGPTRLSRELRRLQVGWGRARYEEALRAVRAAPPLPVRDDESGEEYEARVTAHRAALAAVEALLEALLAVTPEVPERGSAADVRSRVADLARATLGWLALVPVHGQAEQQTLARLRTRLEAVAAIEGPRVGFGAALAELRASLADLRAWPLVTSDRKPWGAAPGMPHLTGLSHAGTTGRPRVFVVGLDGDRTAAGHGQDPFLADALRARLGDAVIATTSLRQRERAWLVAGALASLRGRVTLSYATSGTLDGRDASPAPELLQAFRITRGDASLRYEQLREALAPPACAVPADAAHAIDARDAWLAALADGPLLLDGARAVLEAHPGLAAGIAARGLAAALEPCGHHGVVDSDIPQVGGERPVSPSAIEQLATCPLAWLYRYGLGIRAPQDPEYDPESWLDAAERGSLLHAVYERFGKRWVHRQHEMALPEAEADIRDITREEIARWAEAVPAPSEAVRAAESEALELEALSFLAMERDLHAGTPDGEWASFERGFGEEEGACWAAAGRALRIRGKIDRVDRLPDGTHRVVDYKTGSVWAYRHDAKQGPFRGGRTLQAAIYSRVIERLDGTRVSQFDYRFPTRRGQHEIVRYGPAELAEGERIVERVLAMAGRGHFVPTTDASDCRFCDYRPICRVAEERNGDASCDRVRWAVQASDAGLEVYAIMRAHRAPGGAA